MTNTLNTFGFISAVFSTLLVRYISFASSFYNIDTTNHTTSHYSDIETPPDNNGSVIIPLGYGNEGYDLDDENIEVVNLDWKAQITF